MPTLSFNEETLALHVSHAGKTWRSRPDFRPYFEYLPPDQRRSAEAYHPGNQTSLFFTGEKVYLESAGQIVHAPFQSGVGAGVRSIFKGFRSANGPITLELETRLWIEEAAGVLHCELIPLVDDAGLLRVAWPAPFELRPGRASYTVLPMMQGCLIPNDWEQELFTFSTGLAYSRAAYMPWWGQIDGRAGNLIILDTPWDGGYRLEHPAGGPTLLYPLWQTSLGLLRYTRKLQIHFVADGDYNDLAKIYRAYAREHGLLRTLAEKAIGKERLAKLIGSPIIHTSICNNIQPASHYYNAADPSANYSVTSFATRAAQLRALKQKGVEKAYIHLDGWGVRGYDNQHPDVLPPCKDAGGWEGMRQLVDTCHELGYLIITHDQYRDYYKDAATYNPDQAVQNELGEVPDEAIWAGGEQAFLCAQQAPHYVRRNDARLKEGGVALDGAYLDVFAVVELDECFHPEHRMSRRQCMEYRQQSFAHLGTQGLIVSSEESIDFAVPYLELVHHGPYALAGAQDNGPARGIPVPLFNLVYHDCLILPWSLTTGGWGVPQGESGLLHAYLNGGTGYLSIEAETEEIERLQQLCAFQQRVAHAELLRHEFIDGDLRRQRAIYANGVVVEVDFTQNRVKIGE